MGAGAYGQAYLIDEHHVTILGRFQHFLQLWGRVVHHLPDVAVLSIAEGEGHHNSFLQRFIAPEFHSLLIDAVLFRGVPDVTSYCQKYSCWTTGHHLGLPF